MALTRTFLRSLGIEDDKIQAIIDAHTETVNGWKTQQSDLETKYNDLETKYKAAKETADKLPGIQKELEDLKKEDYKGKYDFLFASVEKEKTRTAKEAAVKAYYEGKNIKGGNLTIALRGTNYDNITLDDDGKLTDTKALDALVEGDFKPLVTASRRTVSSGASVGGDGGAGGKTETSSDVMNRLFRGE